ncbi:MAG: NAD(+) diphosphatase, partial [Lachnospiraceae bacterium]|nr:NAD(+) diphosphatase [Lachnospiraceae bacterium]
IIFDGDKVLIKQTGELFSFPGYHQLNLPIGRFFYLFMISDQKYFLYQSLSGDGLSDIAEKGYEYQPIIVFRELQPRHRAFALITAYQINRWYFDNRFCGRCAQTMETDAKERLLRCPKCGNLVYPRISPAVIVGIVDHDRILLTRYAGREYNRYALVAGFTEIGETLEQTVAREVAEEVGLKIKNIRYYKSQPWSLSGTLLSGFFADLDGSDEILLDETELAEAVWFRRDAVPVKDDGISLTRDMIQAFCDGLDRTVKF